MYIPLYFNFSKVEGRWRGMLDLDDNNDEGKCILNFQYKLPVRFYSHFNAEFCFDYIQYRSILTIKFLFSKKKFLPKR